MPAFSGLTSSSRCARDGLSPPPKPIIDELDLKTFHIFYDGALIYNPKAMSTLYAKPLDKQVVKEAIDFTRKNNIYLELYSSEKFFSEKANWSDDVHRKFFRVEPTTVNFDDIWEKERLLKAEIVVHNDEEAVKAKLFKDNFGGQAALFGGALSGLPGSGFHQYSKSAGFQGGGAQDADAVLRIPSRRSNSHRRRPERYSAAGSGGGVRWRWGMLSTK